MPGISGRRQNRYINPMVRALTQASQNRKKDTLFFPLFGFINASHLGFWQLNKSKRAGWSDNGGQPTGSRAELSNNIIYMQMKCISKPLEIGLRPKRFENRFSIKHLLWFINFKSDSSAVTIRLRLAYLPSQRAINQTQRDILTAEHQIKADVHFGKWIFQQRNIKQKEKPAKKVEQWYDLDKETPNSHLFSLFL